MNKQNKTNAKNSNQNRTATNNQNQNKAENTQNQCDR